MFGKNRPDNPDKLKLNTYHWYTPRFWTGMRTRAWWRLVWRNRFSVSPSRWGIVFTTSLVAPVHSACYRWQELFWRKKVEETPIEYPPIFILGHWRSGTTLLHELLVLDERHTFPTTFECFAPHHFLYSGDYFPRWCKFLLPSQRPMDNMAAGWDRPQEDEFALLNLGLPSIYESLAFPNRGPRYQEYLDFEGVPAEDIQRWKDALWWFIKRVNCRDPRRIVLKSPPHTGRIKVLMELFPDAKFIHVMRDPFVVYSSSVRLWKALSYTQGMQVPRYEGLDEFVLSSFERMYAAFNWQRDLVAPGNFCEVRYEDLVANPVGEMRTIYAALGLGQFDEVLPSLSEHIGSLGEYKTNRYELDGESRDRVAQRWLPYMERYGYGDARAAEPATEVTPAD